MKARDIILVSVQLVLFFLFAIAPSGQITGFIVQTVSFVLTVAGLIILLSALAGLGSSLTPFPTPKISGKLVTSGMYKFVRHPIYTGILLAATGISLYSLSIPKFFITVLLYLLFVYKSKYEEKLLLSKFDGYDRYMKATGRFFPKFKNNSYE